MNRVSTSIALTAALLLCTSGMQAGTIIKLTLGTDALPDIEMIDGVVVHCSGCGGQLGGRSEHRA